MPLGSDMFKMTFKFFFTLKNFFYIASFKYLFHNCFHKCFRRLALLEAIERLEAGSRNRVIYIQPPVGATGEVTDEDSGDEDGGGTVGNLHGRLLQSEVELADSTSSSEEESDEVCLRHLLFLYLP